MQHIPALVQKYIDYLKDRYKAHRISPMLKEGVKIRPKQFIHLNMVSNEEEEEDDELKSKCLLLQLYGDVAAIKKKRRPMEMEDIGRREDQSVAQHILVEGSPGIGKTMFSWELCRQWAEGKMLQDRDIILMLQLRNKRVREAKSLSDLFYHDNDSIKQEVLEHITSVDGRGVFLVLEGYDELTEDQRTDSSILNRLLTGDCLANSSIMVTSRPLASDSLCPEFIDQHIEVVGFNDEDIKSYVEMACQKQPKILPDLMSYIASNPFVSSIMYIPLQCATLTALYIEKWRENKGKAYAPTTLTQLYTDLLLSSLIRYISDHPVYSKCKTKIRQLSDLPSEVQEQVCKLSQLAAEGLENRHFIFDSIPCDHMGLMQSAEEELVIGSSVSYCFLHLTLQEYLAALHWSRMGSEDMVRLVSETSLFPIHTLVRDGITAGHHWPALYFLSGLNKLTSVPLELLKESLQAADTMLDSDDQDEYQAEDEVKLLFQLLDVNLLSLINVMSDIRECNPYFFQMMFETQSRDLTTKLFTHKNNVSPSITNPLECFVTAWCVANSDPTSQWKLSFSDDLLLEGFLKHFVRFTNVSDSTKSSYGSVTGIILERRRHPLVTAELVKSFSSLFPCLEFIAIDMYPAENVPLLCSVVKLSSLKTLIIGTVDQEGDELPAAVCIPPLHCPSLTTIWLDDSTSESLIESLVLPNINTLTTIYLSAGCRPMSGSEFGNFCSCLCQSTSLEFLWWEDVDLSAHELKELVSALEQISSLKMVEYNDDDPILTDVGIRQVKQAMNSSTVIQAINDGTIDKEILEEKVSNMSRPLRSILSDQDSSQSLDLVTADIQSSSHHDDDVEDYELQLALALSASIQTAQDELGSDEEQKHSIQEALPEDGQEENDHDLEDEELQQAIALSLEENIEQRRRDEEQQHSIQVALPEDGQEENDHDLEDEELQLALGLSASIQTAQDGQRGCDEEQQHSIQDAVPEDGQEEKDHDLEDEELQQAIALSQEENIEQRRRDEEQQHAAQSEQDALQSEDDLEKMCSVLSSENDLDLEDEELQQALALSLEENIEQRTLLDEENTWSDDS